LSIYVLAVLCLIFLLMILETHLASIYS
jgi:hypothetical protein